jgi:hypothetical protein
VREVCAAPETAIVLKNETEMFPFPLEYHAATLAACRDKAVVVCADEPRPLTKACPAPDAAARVVSLRYAEPTGGRLKVE